VAQNSDVIEDPAVGPPTGRLPAPVTAPAPSAAGAVPIPEQPVTQPVVVEDVAGMLSAFGADGTGATVDDEERTRYGVLLDRAAGRGLLTPAEYEVRLRELAAATTVEEMVALVTELPVLATAVAPSGRVRPPTGGAGLGRSPTAVGGPRVGPAPSPAGFPPFDAVSGLSHAAPRRSSPWFILAVVVVILVVAMVFFAVYAEHLVHVHDTGLPASPRPVAWLSALRS
jgi:hypothetical protein